MSQQFPKSNELLKRRQLWLLTALVSLITVGVTLSYLSQQRAYWARISLSPDSNQRAFLTSNQDLAEVDRFGRAFFSFHASSQYSKDEKFTLGIRPIAEPTFYVQEQCCGSDDLGKISGIAQLGSPAYPLHQGEEYEFRLANAAKKPVLHGKINVEVLTTVVSNGSTYWSMLVAMFLSIMASIIQISKWLGFELMAFSAASERQEGGD